MRPNRPSCSVLLTLIIFPFFIGTSVTVMVSTDQVQTLVQAMRDGVIDLVAIPNSGDTL